MLGSAHILEIADLSHTGAGVGRIGEAACFVPFSIPGERVRVTVEQVHPRWLLGRLEEVIEPSPDRVAPACPLFGRCGGCTLQHIVYGRQVELKWGFEQATLARAGIPLAPAGRPPVASPTAYGYRRRVRLWLRDGRAGFNRRLSNELVPVARCPLATPEVDAAIDPAGAWALSLDPVPQTIALTVPADGEGLLLRCEVEGERLPEPWNLPAGARCAVFDNDGGRTAFGETRAKVVARAAAFVQANGPANELLRAEVGRIVREELPSGIGSAVELFAGDGNLTGAIAPLLRSVLAIESDPDGTRLLRGRNLPNVAIRQEDLFRHPDLGAARAELLLLDPPRAGYRQLAAAANGCGARAVVYCSCDPATSARDIKGLLDSGWRLQSVRMFDLFPQTEHAELLWVAVREG